MRGGSRVSRVALTDPDAIVVGGGYAGLATALALGRTGRKVLVLEARDGPDRRFRGELIHPAGVRLLTALGVLPEATIGSAQRCHGFSITPDAGGRAAVLEYPRDPRSGRIHDGLFLPHTDLRAMLRDAAERGGVRLLTGETVTSVVRDDGVARGVVTRGRGTIRAPLTVICDGRFSALRRQLGFTPKTSSVSHTLVLTAGDVALPWPGYGHVFLGGPGPVLAYRVRADVVRFCIDVPRDLFTTRQDISELVRSRYLEHLPDVVRGPMADALRSPDTTVSANVSVSGRCSWAPGLVLMGDCASSSHPLTAMGITVGLREAVSLSEELDGTPDQSTALDRFDRRRQHAAWSRHAFTNALHQVFSDTDEVTGDLRAGMFRYWHESPRARQRSMSLLAGEDRRLRTFVAEYVKVARRAAGSSSAGTRQGLRRRTALLGRVLRIGRDALGGWGQAQWAPTAMRPIPVGVHPRAEGVQR